MSTQRISIRELQEDVESLLEEKDFPRLAETIAPLSAEQVSSLLGRLPAKEQAIVYRLLHKERAIRVFELISPAMQGDLIHGLQDADVAAIFADLDPDDRVWLLDELPAGLAPRLLHGLTPKERQLTAEVLGYPKGSVGRRMTPEYVTAKMDATVEKTFKRVRARLDEAETIYSLPVVDGSRRVVGVVSLRDLLRAEPDEVISEIMHAPEVATAYQDADVAARKCVDLGFLALPIVDKESRLVGVLTLDDAAKILEHEETEQSAHQGGVAPLRRPYLATPIKSLVTSRIVWLLVLAVGATLTVQVLSVFETTLEQVTVLALFVPLLIGTGGNTGNQAATTVTRAIALGDVRPHDVWKVLAREMATGLSLGLLLGVLGGGITALAFEPQVGLVIGLTLVAVCTVAASFGGIMPMVARKLNVDPAVFSNPFISTFVDATGLIIYFLIARAVLGI